MNHCVIVHTDPWWCLALFQGRICTNVGTLHRCGRKQTRRSALNNSLFSISPLCLPLFPLSSYITYEELQWITNHVSSFSTPNKGLLHTNLSLRGTIAKRTERCCHKHNNGPTAEMNGVPLYSRLWVACKPPALVLREAVSLSGIHMLTGHNCRFCCEKKGRLWSSHLFCFSLFLLSETTKMENNRRAIPASLCDLDKELYPGSHTSKAVFRT